ncbi:hypothetical protein P3T73_14985 [Kiritimatiellota bacterium B12222]|nr:hypothetical protein P3T73_14985 [Kiritimatiellota bacterium B12222]
MKLTKQQIQFSQLIAGGLLVLFTAILAGSLARIGLTLWFGLLWLALAWTLGLSPLLCAGLVLLTVHVPVTAALPDTWLLAVDFGLSAWVLTLYWPKRISAVCASLLWVSVLWWVPSLLLFVIAGVPRLGRMYEDEGKWVFGPSILLLSSLIGWQFSQGVYVGWLDQVVEVDHYFAWGEAFSRLLSLETLWVLIPLVGLFEVTQKQADDIKFSWRNLTIFGAVLSVLFVPVMPGMDLIYTLGIPLSAILLTRWCFALPDLYARAVYVLGLLLLLFPLLQGGIA